MKKESEVTQLCPTLCDPMDCSLPGSSIHGIFQARILEWVAISFSSKWRDWVPNAQQSVGFCYTLSDYLFFFFFPNLFFCSLIIPEFFQLSLLCYDFWVPPCSFQGLLLWSHSPVFHFLVVLQVHSLCGGYTREALRAQHGDPEDRLSPGGWQQGRR